MSIPISLRLDDEGLLRKECPYCKIEYKVFPESETEEIQIKSYCPLCGLYSSWEQQFTQDQVEHLNQVIQNSASDLLNKSLGNMKKKIRNSPIKMKLTPLEKVDPKTLIEIKDFTQITTGCCSESVFLEYPGIANIIYCTKCGDMNLPPYKFS
ncbi:hypothetical protein [Sporosarcina newyorkensis]|uniref:hypothetical protein n=1 Tax=Sporosarcina newyorkensis TaxID=759851 RepID=UPI003CFF7FEE